MVDLSGQGKRMLCRLEPTVEIAVAVVQLLSHVQLFATPWTAVCLASLSFNTSQSLLKLMPIKSVMPSNHVILCLLILLPSIFPSISVFFNQLFASSSQSIGASASASVLPVNIQGCFPLRLTGLISLLSKGLSRVFSSITIQKHQLWKMWAFF